MGGSTKGEQKLPSVRSRKAGTLRKLGLLMWKNLLLRKRHWLLTLFEIVVPTFLFTLMVSIRVLPDSAFKPVQVKHNSTFKTIDENAIRKNFCNNYGIWGDSSNLTSATNLMNLTLSIHDCYVLPDWIAAQFELEELLGTRKLFYGPEGNWTKKAVTYLAEKMGSQIVIPAIPGLTFENTTINADFTDYMEPVKDNIELDAQVNQLYFQTNDSLFNFFIGVYFNLPDDYDVTSDEPPSQLDYDIRTQNFWFSDFVYPYLQIPGPRNYSLFDGGFVGNYNSDGFTYIQTLIDRFYVSSVVNDEDILSKFELQSNMYPYPPYNQDNGMSQLYGAFLPTVAVLSFVLLCPSLIKNVVYEKETGVRELVRLMGLDSWLVWFGWFLHAFLTIIVTSTIIVFFLKAQLVSSAGGGYFPPILISTDGFFLWVLLILYGISSIAFCMAISTFFSKPTLATTLGIAAWLVSYFIPRGILEYQYDVIGLAPKLASCLLPNMCITWAFRIISMFEGRSVGVQWDNLWETGNARDELTPAHILLMLVFDTFLFLFITWYVDQVSPGKYGVALPYYFPFQKSYWCGTRRKSSDDLNNIENRNKDTQNFEAEPVGLNPGIVINNLRKEFKTMCFPVKVAVEDVTLTCYEGQCTVLLGHNGAGKTTTMSVLTGVYAPTSGSAKVAGWDIATNLKEARVEIGLCPQHNMLFTDLSVYEHLIFFAKLKGLSNKESEFEAKTLMKRLELLDKKHMFGSQLSGGMKRKLCLAISLIGGSKVIILDEPSSGLDPESRRWVWEVIQEEREKRTVLVTTHHMEEADVLGDRVAIMAEGRVICAGSTLFLKKKFGDGYSLTVTVTDDSGVENICKTVSKHLPSANMVSSMGGEIIYRLPSEPSLFGSLLDSLTEQRTSLGIKHVGLSLTSMEQVFLKVGGIIDGEKSLEYKNDSYSNGTNGIDSATNVNKTISNGDTKILDGSTISKSTQELFSSQDDIKQVKITGWHLLAQRLRALFIKRYIYSKRKWVLFLTQGVLPAIITLMCLWVDASFNENTAQESNRKISIEMYLNSKSYVSTTDETSSFGDSYLSLFDNMEQNFEAFYTANITDRLLNDSIIDEFKYRENSICSAEFSENEDGSKIITHYMYQSVPYHCPAVSVNLMDNAILRSIAGNDSSVIKTNNRPMPIDKTWRLGDSSSSGSSFIYSMMMPMALAFLSASFLVFPLEERETKAKQVQIMTGTPTWAMWFTSLIWDMASYILSALLVFFLFMVLDQKAYWTVGNAPGVLFLLLLLYGWGGLSMAYVFSFPFETAASGFAILALFNIVAGQIISTATWALSFAGDPTLDIVSEVLHYTFSLVPAYPASKAFLYMVDISNYNTQCEIFNKTVTDSMCETIGKIDPVNSFLTCCESVDINNRYQYCIPNEDITEHNINSTVPCFEKYSYFRWDEPGLSIHLLYLLADGFLYLLLLTLIELGAWSWIVNKISSCFKRNNVFAIDSNPYIEDEDVVAEAHLVNEMMKSGSQEAAMVVSDLTKHFPGSLTTAVNKVSFHVKRGECLGLLGVNGAGKTTTFRMLTADEEPTAGNAMIDGITLKDKRGKKFLERIGYCPQFDATLGELTGVEMLMLVGRLRGMPEHQLKHTTKTLVNLVDIIECADRPSSTYSGGNRRKLSTAMALIGTPSLVFLDEPTSGVDPASRRRVWSSVQQAVANGQSIVLTSHSMEECEALCSRIVIMAKGRLKCVGSSAHLKSKYGQGYSLQVKLKTDAEQYDNRVEKLKADIQSNLPNSRIIDEHKGMLAYQVPTNITWGNLFSAMEALKSGQDIVEDYAASDTSLEQVFLSFAREPKESNRLSSIPMEIVTKF